MYTVYTVTIMIPNVFFIFVGVFIVWASWGSGRLGVKYLNKRLAEVGASPNWLLVTEFVVAMFMGVFIVTCFVEPETPQQAIAAGMGWASLITKPASDNKSENDHEDS